MIRANLLFFIGLLTMVYSDLWSQSSNDTQENAHRYAIGYTDTILYDNMYPYAEYGYEGPAPLFLQVWHPIAKSTEGNYLSQEDLRSRTLPPNLEKTYKALCEKMDSAAIWYNISRDLNGDSLQYGKDTSYFDILQLAHTAKTNGRLAPLPKVSDYPVLVYHHGAQGFSDENIDLAEYFASRGYIVVSSNFHLPYENMVYGSSDHDIPESLSLINTVVQFADELSTSNPYYIGHSMGAQKGLVNMINDTLIAAFVSLETTIEFVDTSEAPNIWPFLDSVLNTQEYELNIPTLMISSTYKDEPFPYFASLATNEMYHVIPKAGIDHESYTSANFHRLKVATSYHCPDSSQLTEEQKTYRQILELIKSHFDSVRNQSALTTAPFLDNFLIHLVDQSN